MGRPMTILVAMGIWLVATAIAVPQLLYFQTITADEGIAGTIYQTRRCVCEGFISTIISLLAAKFIALYYKTIFCEHVFDFSF